MGNTGHGHVFPREDGVKARCGGPGMCAECSADLAIKHEDDRRAGRKSGLVKDAHKWTDMAGDTSLEKILNAYLTTMFIVARDVPADECLGSARHIIKIVREYGELADTGAALDALGRDMFYE